MIRQTVLTFKGALGFLGYRDNAKESSGDSGNSSPSQSSDEEQKDTKNFYTTSGVLVPRNQKLNEITISRLSQKEISSKIEAYQKQKKHERGFFKLFDTKQMVKKHENQQSLCTKIPAEQVRLLAQDAFELVTGLSEGVKRTNLIFEEEKKGEASQLLDLKIHNNMMTMNEQEQMMLPDKGYKISKREAKRRLKEERSQYQQQKLRNQALDLKMRTGLTDKQLSLRLKKSIYWVRQSLGKQKFKNQIRIQNKKKPAKFGKINERVASLIKKIISDCQAPLQLPYLLDKLKADHKVVLSSSLLRRYLRERLCMTYRRLGVVGKHYDDHSNLLKRQIAAGEYIRALRKGLLVINIDESIIRSTDQRQRGWAAQGRRIFTSNSLRLPRISMIAAITSQGSTFFSINQGKNTTLTFLLFITELSQLLDAKDRNWRASSTILLDNASIHRSKEALAAYEALGLPIMFLAPYSFRLAPVEKLFAFVKNRDLNPLVARAYSRQVADHPSFAVQIIHGDLHQRGVQASVHSGLQLGRKCLQARPHGSPGGTQSNEGREVTQMRCIPREFPCNDVKSFQQQSTFRKYQTLSRISSYHQSSLGKH